MKAKKYIFEFSSQGEKTLKKLDKQVQIQILQQLKKFSDLDNPLEKAVKLTGTKDTYRFRSGDYRVIVRPDNHGNLVILVVLKVAHRKHVYD